MCNHSEILSFFVSKKSKFEFHTLLRCRRCVFPNFKEFQVCASKLAGEGKNLYCVKCAATVDLVVVAPAKICVSSVASILYAMQKRELSECRNVACLGFYFQRLRVSHSI